MINSINHSNIKDNEQTKTHISDSCIFSQHLTEGCFISQQQCRCARLDYRHALKITRKQTTTTTIPMYASCYNLTSSQSYSPEYLSQKFYTVVYMTTTELIL